MSLNARRAQSLQSWLKSVQKQSCAQGAVIRLKKIMSACTFELKGGGWYADGYSHKNEGKSAKKRR